jgi:hypothetical protein
MLLLLLLLPPLRLPPLFFLSLFIIITNFIFIIAALPRPLLQPNPSALQRMYGEGADGWKKHEKKTTQNNEKK